MLLFAQAVAVSAQDGGQPSAMQRLQLDDLAKQESAKKKGEHTLSLNADFGAITSKVYTYTGTHTWQTGTGFEVSYRYIAGSGYGIALSFLHNQTEYSTRDGNADLDLYFWGPSFVYGGEMGKHWYGHAEIGIGLAKYSEPEESQYGAGIKTAFGVEYRPWKFVGIGLDIVNTTSTFSNQKYFFDTYDTTINGFNRLGLNLGFRFHL